MEKSVMDEIIWRHLRELNKELKSIGVRKSFKFAFLDDDPILLKKKSLICLDTQKEDG